MKEREGERECAKERHTEREGGTEREKERVRERTTLNFKARFL